MNKTIAKLGRRLRLGVIGGGPGSFIGTVHRTAARLDDNYEVVAVGPLLRPGALARSRPRHRPAPTIAPMAAPARCSTARARAPTAWRSSPS